MGQPQVALGLVQLIVQLGLLFVGQAVVDPAQGGHVLAAVLLAHSAHPVLAVHQIVSAIPVADHQRGEQAGVPLPDQLVHIAILDRALIGLAGVQFPGGKQLLHALEIGVHACQHGLLRIRGGTLFLAVTHFWAILSIL